MSDVSVGIGPGGISLGFGGGGGGDANLVDIIDSVTGIVKGYSDFWGGLTNQEINQNEALIRAYSEQILGELQASDADVAGLLNRTESNIITEILQGILLNHEANRRIEGRVIDAVEAAASNSTDQVSRVIDVALDPVVLGNNQVLDTLSGLNTAFDVSFGDLSFDVGSILDILKGGLQTTILNKIIIPEQVFDVIFGQVTDQIAILTNGHLETVRVFDKIINETLTVALEEGNAIDAERRDALEEVAEILAAGVDNQIGVEQVGGAKSIAGNVGQFISDVLNKYPGIDPGGIGTIARKLEDLFNNVELEEAIRLDCDVLLKQPIGMSDVGRKFYEWFVEFIALIMQPMNMAQVQANIDMQRYRECHPDALMGPGDLAAAWHRNLISTAKAGGDLNKQGYTTEDATALLNSSFIIPDITFLFSMWYRGLKTDDELVQALLGHGYKPEDINDLVTIALFIPPAQDLINMAVREVFSEAQARAQGQFDDFPEDFAKYAAMQGISREWAERYWAAHWRLPSEQMGFEMLHRQIIDEKKLDSLMVALDIMPGWREEIVAISYTPFSRVDIRRMHKLGVLDDAQVVKAYRDIGYSPADSELQLQFVKELNEDEDLLTLDVASDLTRANIIGFYKDGIIEEPVALALMLQAGINVVAAELFILSANFDIERKDRKDSIDLIMDKYRFGSISFVEATDQIRALDLAPKENDLALLDLTRLQEQLNKLPSRADLDKFIKNGLISDTVYLDTMEAIGYNFFWAEKYLSLASNTED